MTQTLRIALAQLNLLVGDVRGNTRKLLEQARAAEAEGADLVVFPELALSGYPPEDLLLRPAFHREIEAALAELASAVPGIAQVVGHPEFVGGRRYNAASVLQGGRILATYRKQHLPNYSVFDEKRYFRKGDAPCVVDIAGVPVALTICEDLWHAGAAAQAREAGAKLILSPNASPYHDEQHRERARILKARAEESGLPVVYVNQVGGQDELVFDGCSLVTDGRGEIVHCLPAFAEARQIVEFAVGEVVHPLGETPVPAADRDAEVYQALVLGVCDYVQKNRFPGAIIGLSGGIDSALTLAIAVDALGPERVRAVMMPFRYTAEISVDDARVQAEAMGVQFDIVSIEPMYHAFMAGLDPLLDDKTVGVMEQNIQARCRGLLLMALSNKTGRIVLTTGNKSEMAVGYATLYGDMAGGFDVLKDVFKTQVYRLAEYRNRIAPAIPPRVIERAPSAELAPDQKDEDNLPPYGLLDRILAGYIEQDQSIEELIAAGYPEEAVRRACRLVDISEHKRRQAAPGPRVSKRNFGRDRRYPITNGYGRP
ncbi:MAG: NAD+ synthase [Gammaproteobacteria bacterium]|nr:NAD+ synthase [Gammaproteobacteria bacterium]